MPNENDNQPDAPQGQEGDGDKGDDKLLGAVNELGDSIKGIGERVDDLSGRVDNIGQPEPETGEDEELSSSGEEKTKEDWTPGTWKDVDKRMDDKVQGALTQKEKEAEEQRREEEERVNNVNKEFDEQEEQLKKDGILPDVKDKDNPEDPGRVARKKLYGRAHKLNTRDIAKVGKELYELKEQGFDYDLESGKFIKMDRENPGKNAPIGSSSNRTSTPASGKLPYKDLHRSRSLDEVEKRYQGS